MLRIEMSYFFHWHLLDLLLNVYFCLQLWNSITLPCLWSCAAFFLNNLHHSAVDFFLLTPCDSPFAVAFCPLCIFMAVPVPSLPPAPVQTSLNHIQHEAEIEFCQLCNPHKNRKSQDGVVVCQGQEVMPSQHTNPTQLPTICAAKIHLQYIWLNLGAFKRSKIYGGINLACFFFIICIYLIRIFMHIVISFSRNPCIFIVLWNICKF